MRRSVEAARLAATVTAEGAVLVVLWRSGPVMGSVGWSHLGAWMAQTAATAAVLAVLRVAAMAVTAWLLVTTVVYLGAVLAGAQRLARRAGWVTLPLIRRIVDGVAAASIMASAFAASTAATVGTPSWASTPALTSPAHHPPSLRAPAAVTASGASGTAQTSARPAPPGGPGRHLPHPGVVAHPQLAAYQAPSTPTAGVASAANGFAGLTPGTKVVVVEPGECMSVIAERYLGGDWQNGDREIHALNAGRLQPDGRVLSDDHWIYPGWVLVMPADAVGTLVVPGPPGLTTGPAPADTPGGAVPASGAPARPAPAVPRSATVTLPSPPVISPPGVVAPHDLLVRPAGRRVTAGGLSASVPSTADSGSKPAVEVHSRPAVGLPGELIGAGILSAGVVVLLGRLSRVAQGRRRRGRRNRPASADGARVELAALAGADEELMALVDLGCRFLAAQLEGCPPAPPVIGVEATSGWLAVLLGERVTKAPDGWEVGGEGQSWVLADPARLVAMGDDLDVAHPFPGLVSVGTTGDGVTVLVNLSTVGLLAVGGDISAAAGVVTAAAAELATVPWTAGCEVILVGFGEADGLGMCEQVHLADTLDDCIERLIADRAGTVGTGGDLRVADDTGVYPSIVLCAQPADPAALARLEALAGAPRSAVVAVTVAAEGADSAVTVDSDGVLCVGPLARTVTAHKLAPSVLARLESRIAEAADTADYDPADAAARDDWWPAEADTACVTKSCDVDGPDVARSEFEQAAAGEADVDVIDLSDTPRVEPGGGPGPGSGGGSIHWLVSSGAAFPALPEKVISPPPDVVVRILSAEPTVLRRLGDGYEPVDFKRTGAKEAVVYLACHPGGVSANRLATAMQPHLAGGGAASSSTFGPEISAARSALGCDGDGRPYLPRWTDSGGRYRLADSVVSDWHLLQRLVTAAATVQALSERIRLLETAMAMVGPDGPLSDLRSAGLHAAASGRRQRWRWLQVEIRGQLESDVVDLAGDLAELHLRAGDPRAAGRAASRGLRVSPLSRDLHCLSLASAAARGAGALDVAWADTERIFEAEGEPFDGIGAELKAHYCQLRSRCR